MIGMLRSAWARLFNRRRHVIVIYGDLFTESLQERQARAAALVARVTGG